MKINILLVLTFICSCSSLPESNLVLNKDLTEEKRTISQSSYEKGAPIYIKTFVHPHIDNKGHLHEGEYVHLFIGRQYFDVSNLVGK